MTKAREFKNSPVPQGVDEEIAYYVDTLLWGGTPTSITAVVKDLTTGGTDVTATKMPGTPTVLGNVITLPLLKALVLGHRYRVEVKFTSGGNKEEAYGFVEAEE